MMIGANLLMGMMSCFCLFGCVHVLGEEENLKIRRWKGERKEVIS